ncbi:MAG: PQQ-binding-like beta-propeller repeat protein, partial [bacterium]|nr:PQQ-binding-like beta-propeller repeat protein [bacterium]
LVSTGGNRAVSYHPASGRELWWITYNGFSLVPRPVFGNGLVYLTSGFHDGILFAIQPNGRGDITDTEKVVWTWNRGVPMTSSPILIGDELYIVSDNGIATCLDAKTGQPIWRERFDGGHSASPVSAAGRIYFLNETGLTTVIKAGRDFEVLARNQLDGSTLASIAIDRNTIYLRSETALYRID